MRKISNVLFLSLLGASVLTGCKNDGKEIAENEVHGINLAYMDTTVSPKQDFFRYANGKWLDSTEIPGDRTSWGSFYELREKTDADVIALLDKASAGESMDPNGDPAKAVYLYKSILDTVSRNEKGIEPIKVYLEKLEAISNKEDLQNYLEEIEQVGTSAFFNFYVDADAKNSKIHSGNITPAGLGLPDRDYYVKDDADSKEKRQKYVEHVTRMLQYLGDSEEEAAKTAEAILAFETRLAKPRMDKVERRDARKTYNPMAVSELQQKVPAINWKAYLQEIGAGNLDTVIVAQPEYMDALQDILAEGAVNEWKSYLRWTTFNRFAELLTTDIQRADWEFYNKTLRGAQEQRPAKDVALAMVNNTIGQALGKLYVKEYFPAEAKQKAEEMISNIIKAYENRINNLSWMSEETKKKAIEKLGTTRIKVGYPDTWQDFEGLTIKDTDNGGTYFKNYLNARKWSHKENVGKLDEPVDKSEWLYMSPQTVNAYYNPSFNEIVFPAAILQPPFYDYKADAAVNYGGIGAVIGHEISHGFDDSGARFDAEGNLNNWWTDEDLKQFETLGTDLADQYSAIEVLDSVYINGKFTLGENIGDLGGVNAAYDGLQIHLKEHGTPGEIDGYTPEQRFFLSWATVWRTKMREEALKNRIKTDPHSPGMYRAYVPLQNIDAFYAAFDIEPGDEMYVKPENRVRIW